MNHPDLDISLEVAEALSAIEKDRDALYQALLDYFVEHGSLPQFTLKKVT